MRELPVPLPASRRALLESGWTPGQIRHAVHAGWLTSPRRGVLGPTWQERSQARALVGAALAARQSCPRAAISHRAAAVLHGLPVLTAAGRPCLTVPAGTALSDLDQAHLHRATLPVEQIVRIDHTLLTSPARTALDIAREHGVDDGLIAADAALRLGLARADQLGAVLDLCARWPGGGTRSRSSSSPMEVPSRRWSR